MKAGEIMKEEKLDILCENGVYRCPVCGSKRILTHYQAIVQKVCDTNANRDLNPYTLKSYMSNRQKAHCYDCATGEGVGCWSYECRKCGWESDVCTE